MEFRGISTTSQRRPVGAITQTTLENRIKRSITIDPTVGSRSNLFHVFPEAAATASGRGHSTDNAREPGQKVHN